ncbi:hypothetical protein TNCV_4435101 [Trichonephila clavipes]|nr:hypothetical protein TNCV_4435101 [Trichonephila clavipes]
MPEFDIWGRNYVAPGISLALQWILINGSEGYDEYVPPDEENVSSERDTVSNFPVQCTSRKTTSGKKTQCVNIPKKLSDSNPDEMNSGTFVTNYGMCWKSITSGLMFS